MKALHMLSMTVDLRELRRLSAIQGFGADEGRALHHVLCEAFGKGVVKPFRLMPGRHGATKGTLYGYADSDAEAFGQTLRETAPPEVGRAFDLSSLASKTMPSTWPAGRRLAFDVRVRPVRRLIKKLEGSSREARRDPEWRPAEKGSEMDAFLVARLRAFPDDPSHIDGDAAKPSREDVYKSWFRERLQGAATLDERATRLASYERRRVLRGRALVDGPDAILHGELTIADSQAFARLLAHGVGRHAAYGYGMLLLRPARV